MTFFVADFPFFAKMAKVKRGAILVHDGYRYHRNRQIGENTHWICSTYSKHRKGSNCKGRATTRMIDGYEMLRINAPHSHPPH